MSSVDFWLKVDGVEGESKDSKLDKAFSILGWSWGEKNLGSWDSNSGGGSGKVKMEDFEFKMPFNKAAPKLFVMCASGEHIKSAELVCRKSGGGQQEFLNIKFSDLMISSFEAVAGENGQEANVIPEVKVTINFAKIEINYQEQNADGSVGATTTAGYDLKKNAKA